MKIVDGIAYEDGEAKILHVISVRPGEEYRLFATFQDGVTKVYDFSPLLEREAFKSLRDVEKFNRVTLDHGVPTWEEENLDLSPEAIYANGVTA